MSRIFRTLLAALVAFAGLTAFPSTAQAAYQYTGQLKVGETLLSSGGDFIASIKGYSDSNCSTVEVNDAVVSTSYVIPPKLEGRYVILQSVGSGGSACAGPVTSSVTKHYTGELKVGQKLTAVAGYSLGSLQVHASQTCSDNPAYANSANEFEPDMAGKYVRVQWNVNGDFTSSRLDACDGPIAPGEAPPVLYTGTVKVGEVLTAAPDHTFKNMLGYGNDQCVYNAVDFRGSYSDASGKTTLTVPAAFDGAYVLIRFNDPDGNQKSTDCIGPVPGAPKYTGTIKAGETLTATSGWTIATVDAFVGDQCSSSSEEDDRSPNSSTWTIPDSWTNLRISMHLTGPNGASETVECVGPVAAADKPYTGSLKVGEKLTAKSGVYLGQGTVYSAATCEDDTAVWGFPSNDGSGSTTLPPQAADKYVTVAFADYSTSSNGVTGVTGCLGPVSEGTFDDLTTATYTGTTTVGQTLTAVAPTVPAGTTVSYQWLIGEDEIGTEQSLVLPASSAAAGKSVTLKVKATGTGYQTKSVTSAPITVDLADFDEDELAKFALIDSTPSTPPNTGDELSIDTSTASFPEGTTVHTRFSQAGSSDCPTADALQTSTRALGSVDIGTKICGTATVQKSGYATTTVKLYSDTVVGAFSDATVAFDRAPQVGVTSTPSLVGLTPEEDSASYVWKVDGDQVSTASSYTPTAADAGKKLTLTVTVAKTNYQSADFASEATTVKKGVLESVKPTISGEPKVGQKLVASVPSGQIPDGSVVSYLWAVRLPGEQTCESIGVESKTLTLPRSAQGAKVCVFASVNAEGYESASARSDLTEEVVGMDPVAWIPTIDDTTPTFGQKLTASVADRDLPSGAEATFKWGHKVDDACELLDSAAADTHVVGLDDLGEQLCVVSTVKAVGYQTGSATSRYTAAAVKASMGTVTAALDNTAPKVGQTITASVAGDDIPSGATKTYTFGVGGGSGCVLDAPGSTTDTRAVQPSDLDKKLCFKATLTAPGYNDASVTSLLTTAVTEGAFMGGSVALSASPVVGEVVSMVPTLPEHASEQVSYEWKIDGAVVSDEATFRPKQAYQGMLLRASVTFVGNGYQAKSVTVTKTVAAAPKKVVSSKSRVSQGEPFAVTATGLKAGQAAVVKLSGKTVWKGYADEYGTVSQQVSFSAKTKPKVRTIRVSGYDKVKNGKFKNRSYTQKTTVTLVKAGLR